MKNVISIVTFFVFLILFIAVPVLCGIAAVNVLAMALTYASLWWVLLLTIALFAAGISAECFLIQFAQKVDAYFD